MGGMTWSHQKDYTSLYDIIKIKDRNSKWSILTIDYPIQVLGDTSGTTRPRTDELVDENSH